MKFFVFLSATLLFSAFICSAQIRQGTYNFEDGLMESTGTLPKLDAIGCSGNIIEEYLPEMQIRHNVYRFFQNCGLSFNNLAANNFFTDSYTIEIYFRLDNLNSWKRVIDWKNRSSDNGAYIHNGKLNFYNIVTSEPTPVRAGEYTHYLLTRNGRTQQIKIYTDGIGKTEFIDSNGEGILSTNRLNFFYDDKVVSNEASSGAVAYIKLFDYALTDKEALNEFIKLPVNLSHTVNQSRGYVFTGRVLTEKTKNPVKGAIGISKLANNSIFETNSEGIFKFEVNELGQHFITVSAPGYFPQELLIQTNNHTAPSEIYLSPITTGAKIVFKTVHFEKGESVLLSESFPELDRLVFLLRENPLVSIQINGHTDNQGPASLNAALSERRVHSVIKYFISKGIAPARLKGKAFGGTTPIADNSKENTRRLNRRVEFIILSN